MARLDPLIDKLFSAAASQLVLETGQGAVLHTAAGAVPLVRQPLSTEQILQALGELAPALFPAGAVPATPAAFAYASPNGAVEVRVEGQGNAIRAALARAPRGSATPTIPPFATGPSVPAPAAAARPGARPGAGAAESPRAAMEALLALLVERKASDLHLCAGEAPVLRVDGDITPLVDYGPIPAGLLGEMLWAVAPARNREEWERCHDTDFAHETALGRFRGNVFADRRGIGAVFRLIPNDLLTAEDLGMPAPVLDLCLLPKGLVLVTGPTGSGKSTTLAALIDFINRNRDDHIITIEDPIEFVHRNKRCLVNQREVGTHTDSFKRALRAALREDPDVVLVGELRDLETMEIAMETAETGHLVFGTLHTNTAPSTVDRIIDQFPADRQQQIRLMLAEALKGVIAQTLCKKVGGGRVAALEVLLCPSSVSNLIREGKTFQIPSVMQTARGQGMVTLNDALLELVKRKAIEPAEAYRKAVAKQDMRTAMERAGFQLVPAKTGALPPVA
jgi:twitching motility protein PilT